MDKQYNLTETQELWVKKMELEHGMTRHQAVSYLYYNA